MRWLFALLALLFARADALAEVDETLIRSGRPAALLSQYGLFDDGLAQIPSAGVHAYDIATPLFSDHAAKFRFVHVPSGQTAVYRGPHAVFDFPPGSVLVKTFAYPPLAAGGAMRLIETRLLLHSDRGWKAWSYVWEGDDARLALAGARIPLEIDLPSGARTRISYAVPNANQCKGCHNLSGTLSPIGPKPRNLNRIYGKDAGSNQLAQWAALGLVSGLPAPAQIEALPDWRDGNEALARRARAWLDVNCAHCHRPEGPASTSGLYLEYERADARALGIGKRPVAAGRGSGGRAFDIAPGDPGGSILLYRIESTDPGIMMPELGRSLVDEEAVRLIRDWIAAMPERDR